MIEFFEWIANLSFSGFVLLIAVLFGGLLLLYRFATNSFSEAVAKMLEDAKNNNQDDRRYW